MLSAVATLPGADEASPAGVLYGKRRVGRSAPIAARERRDSGGAIIRGYSGRRRCIHAGAGARLVMGRVFAPLGFI